MFNFIAQLPLRRKLALVVVAMLIPLSMLAYLTATTEIGNMRIAQSENTGLKWASSLVTVAANMIEYTEHSVAIAAGAEEERPEMMEHSGLVHDAMEELDKLAADSDTLFVSAANWSSLKPRVEAALNADGADPKVHDMVEDLVRDIYASVDKVAEVSTLKLDPGADTFPLMLAAILQMPQGIEALGTARRNMDAAAAGDNSIPIHAEIAEHTAIAQTLLRSAMHALADSYGDAAQQSTEIPGKAAALNKRLEATYAALKNDSHDVEDSTSAADLAHEAEILTEDLTALRVEANSELSALLDARASAAQRNVIIYIVVALAFMAFAFYVSIQVTRYIAGKLNFANDVFVRLAEGSFDNEIGAQPGDELGTLINALQKMQGELRGRVEADQRAAAVERERAAAAERVKQALDASSVSVVIADNNLDVIYLNQAAQALMSGAQHDFRRVLPGFDAARLVGTNLGSFFQDGAHQCRTISALKSSQAAEHVYGSRTLKTIVNPVFDAEGKRLGTIVEWVDRTQEVATEKEIGDLVVAVSDGKLDQRVSLAGKQGFFEALAQGLNGLVTSVDEVVAELRGLVESANAGDLTRSMQLAGKPGLYVSIGTGVNALVANMAGVVSQVKSVASEVHGGAEEIAKGNTNLSQRTEEQASSLEETASSMEEMTSTVKQTADNAGQANQLAMAAREQAEKGGAVVSNAVTAMSAINGASKKIADIIGVIDEIAFQTNLLALNAAVEAARAGEQGRGFAVVATEVRNLAGRSATAAKEIKALIQDSVAKVDEGSRLVHESGKTLDEIVQAVKKVTDIVAEIAAASREQSSGIEQVNRAVMQMDETTQQNAALVEQAAAASEAIVEQAKALNSVIARYKINDAAQPANPAVQPAAPARSSERRGRDRAWSKTKAAIAPSAPLAAVSNGDSEWSEF